MEIRKGVRTGAVGLTVSMILGGCIGGGGESGPARPTAAASESLDGGVIVGTPLGRIVACAVSTQVLLGPDQSRPSPAACEFAGEVREKLTQSPPVAVTIAEGNGWFLREDRSACVAYPIVKAGTATSYFAYVQRAEDAVVVTANEVAAPLPEGLELHVVTPTPREDYFVADLAIAGQAYPGSPIAQRIEGAENCK